jgi:hypothetical protein
MNRYIDYPTCSSLAVCAGLLIVGVGCGASSDAGANSKGGSGNTAVGGSANIAGGAGGGQAGGGGLSLGGTGATVGGSANGGNGSTAGGSTGTGGTSVVASTGTLGQQCSTPGQLACAGINQKLTLVCGGSNTWQVNQTCSSATQVCDPRPGSTAGTCQEQDPLCATATPGVQFCNAYAEWICDAWAMEATKVQDCPIGACANGNCLAATGCLTEWNFLSCSSDCTSVLDTSARCSTNIINVAGDPTGGLTGSAIVHQSYANSIAVGKTGCLNRKYFYVSGVGYPNGYERVQVSSPWLISRSTAQLDCISNYPGTSCEILQPGANDFTIFTDDPAATPANVYMQASASTPPACP